MSLPTLPFDSAKLEWRIWARARRKMLLGHSSEPFSSAVQGHLHRFLLEQGVERALSYRAFGSEISLELLPTLLPQVEFYAPRAALTPQPHLTLHPWSARVVRSKLGMLEPAPDAPEMDVTLLGCVLLPGLAFDSEGFRLGYGMGFYDFLLEKLPSSVLRVGVCSSEMWVERLPREDHDQPVQWLADESGVHRLS